MKFTHPHQQLRRKLGLVVGLGLLVASVPAIASATSQSFNVLNDQAQPGMLMSLTPNSGVVEPANSKNAASLIGVLTTDASLSQEPGQVSIATDGQTDTLVSTLGGDIKVGDRIGVSSLTGIGSKLTKSGWMVGVAEASLDAKTTGAVKTTVSDTAGAKQTVYLAHIPLIIKVNYFTAPAAANTSSLVPASLQNLADKIAGKHASLLSLILSFVLMLTGLVWAGSVIYAAVRGSIDALARQPLSKAVITQAMIRSIGVALAVVSGVLLGAFLLLRLV